MTNIENNNNKDVSEDTFVKNKSETKGEKKVIRKNEINDSPDKKIAKNKDEKNNKKKEKENKKSTNYEEEIAKLRDERLRVLAEMENVRKRSAKEKVESIKFGSANLARDILSPSDNLTRALENIPEEKNRSDLIKNLIDGLNMIQKELKTILEKHGVKKIDAINKKFDHNFHQAVFEVEKEEVDEGIVVQEIQSGYIMHERLLRPTMVGVSKKPIKDKKKE